MYRLVVFALAGGAPGARATSAARRLAGFEFDDATLRPAVAEWFENRSAAEARYGSIGLWDTRRVTDMSGLFAASANPAAASFNEDISRWQTG